MTEMVEEFDVVVIGAGPAGALAATLLANKDVRVLVLEKTIFPRFVIGESLLPQSMAYLEKAGLLQAVEAASFQKKNGASFCNDLHSTSINFCDKFTEGWDTTYQVPRDEFDMLLAQEAGRAGADVRFDQTVTDVSFDETDAVLKGTGPEGNFQIKCRFVVDASGYGRVLPRLLSLNTPSDFPKRHALFTHVTDKLVNKDFDREKILITVHPENPEIWFWLIPFSEGCASVGAVVPPEVYDHLDGTLSEKLWTLIGETDQLQALLQDAEEKRPVAEITGYSSKVTKMCSPQFALLGNASEFLDPVFSSGVTIAFKSADLLIEPLLRQLKGETVDWNADFETPLRKGVDCFRAFVEAWYQGDLQKIIFDSSNYDTPVKKMIVSILAGYAWDEKNPFVNNGKHYLGLVAAQCE